jgi:hypothetical protein
MHQVADLPHQRLVAVEDRLRRGSVVVEAGGGHRLFELLNLGFGLGDSRFERGEAITPGLYRLLLFARLGVDAFFFFV